MNTSWLTEYEYSWQEKNKQEIGKKNPEALEEEEQNGKVGDLLEVLTGNLEIKLFDLGIWPFRAVEFDARLKRGPDSEGTACSNMSVA